jgi:predicted membrane channel-forming protein YqfA (hemolysin III family)
MKERFFIALGVMVVHVLKPPLEVDRTDTRWMIKIEGLVDVVGLSSR